MCFQRGGHHEGGKHRSRSAVHRNNSFSPKAPPVHKSSMQMPPIQTPDANLLQASQPLRSRGNSAMASIQSLGDALENMFNVKTEKIMRSGSVQPEEGGSEETTMDQAGGPDSPVASTPALTAASQPLAQFFPDQHHQGNGHNLLPHAPLSPIKVSRSMESITASTQTSPRDPPAPSPKKPALPPRKKGRANRRHSLENGINEQLLQKAMNSMPPLDLIPEMTNGFDTEEHADPCSRPSCYASSQLYPDCFSPSVVLSPPARCHFKQVLSLIHLLWFLFSTLCLLFNFSITSTNVVKRSRIRREKGEKHSSFEQIF